MKNLFYNIALMTFLISGCSTTSNTLKNYELLSKTINVGSGGGVTGIYDGFYLDSTGVVYKWSGSSFIYSKKDSIGVLSQDHISKLNKLMDKPLEEINYRNSGNLNFFITVKNSNSEQTYSWINNRNPEDMPERLKYFYNEISEAIKNLNK